MSAEVGVAARIVVASAIVAGVVCAGWVWLAPRPQVRVSENELVSAVSYPETYAAGDMILALFCLGAGLLLGSIGCIRYRRPSLGVVIGLLIGGLIGAALAWQVGLLIAGGASPVPTGHPEGSILTVPLTLRSKGVLMLWPAAALVLCSAVNLARWNRTRFGLSAGLSAQSGLE